MGPLSVKGHVGLGGDNLCRRAVNYQRVKPPRFSSTIGSTENRFWGGSKVVLGFLGGGTMDGWELGPLYTMSQVPLCKSLKSIFSCAQATTTMSVYLVSHA